MNKNKIIIIISISVFLIFLGSFLTFSSLLKNNQSVEPNNTEKKKKTDDEIHISTDSDLGSLIEILFQYANEIYAKNGYLNYPKVDGMYFVSFNQLANDYGYDISMFRDSNKICDGDLSGISFDVDSSINGGNTNKQNSILPKFVGCFDDYK